jgi:hypothetical protein
LSIAETNRRIAEQCNEAFNRGDLDAQQTASPRTAKIQAARARAQERWK